MNKYVIEDCLGSHPFGCRPKMANRWIVVDVFNGNQVVGEHQTRENARKQWRLLHNQWHESVKLNQNLKEKQ